MFVLSKYNSLILIGLIAILFFGTLSGCDFISCGGDLTIHEACAKGCYKTVERMIDEDPSLANAEHERMQELPLHFAGSAKVAQLLIDNGADVNALDGFGDTPLHDAVKAEVAELLISEGADVNAFNEVQETPLHRVKNAEVARILIENGADVNGMHGERVSPLYSAVLAGPCCMQPPWLRARR